MEIQDITSKSSKDKPEDSSFLGLSPSDLFNPEEAALEAEREKDQARVYSDENLSARKDVQPETETDHGIYDDDDDDEIDDLDEEFDDY